jgi:DNA-binding winged helix-turn-helix (wHTH) protein
MGDDIIAFGSFRLSIAERLLEQNGRSIKLSGRALDILIALVERAGQIVQKRDLMACVWPDVTVDENSLRFHVAALRKALGDGQAGARYLVTFPGRGYCFVAPISRLAISGREIKQTSVREQFGTLPVQLTHRINRTASRQEMSGRPDADCFVTIVGSDGIAKAAVGLSLPDMSAVEFEGGVCFCVHVRAVSDLPRSDMIEPAPILAFRKR